MGMTCGLYRASATEIEQLLNQPDSIEAFIEASSWAPPVREVRPKGILGWLMKLSPVTVVENDPDAEPPPGYDHASDRPHCDLEGVWHGLHYLFTGTAWEGDEPACYLIRGGEDIGDADELGYSVLQALSPDKVQRFAAFLNALSHDELAGRFNPARMRDLEVEPAHRDHSPIDRLLDGYDQLRAFVTAAAEAGAGAVVYVT
jgi:uncharacterized protein DUF1877